MGMVELVFMAGTGAISEVCKLPLPSVTSTPVGPPMQKEVLKWRRERKPPPYPGHQNPSDPPEYLILL